jgi:hypothetical protein
MLTPPLENWVVAAALTVAVGAIAAAADATSEQEEQAALASRHWAAQQKCNGRPYTWADDKTLHCARQKGQP